MKEKRARAGVTYSTFEERGNRGKQKESECQISQEVELASNVVTVARITHLNSCLKNRI